MFSSLEGFQTIAMYRQSETIAERLDNIDWNESCMRDKFRQNLTDSNDLIFTEI